MDWTKTSFDAVADKSPEDVPMQWRFVAGSGRAKLDDEITELRPWDVLRVAPAVMRSFEAGPDGMDVICIGGRKPASGGDTERDPSFWP